MASKKITFFSYLRLAAIFGVIVLHVSSTLLDNPELFTLSSNESLFFRSLIAIMTWCAPCFLMITGALLLDTEKTISIRTCVFKYTRRLVLALLLFGIPFALLMDFSATRKISLSLIPSAFLRVLTNQSFAHLWYVYMMIGIYLLLPAIKVFINNSSEILIKYVLLLFFIFNFVFPLLSKLTGLSIAFELPVSSCYLFYLLLGYYIYTYKPSWTSNLSLTIICLIIFQIVMVGGTVADKTSLHGFATYNNPFTALSSICVFSLFQRIQAPLREKIWALDRLTFGVYLIHPLFIHFLFRIIHITPTGTLFLLKTFCVSCAVSAVSFVCIWIMSMIPFVKKYVL